MRRLHHPDDDRTLHHDVRVDDLVGVLDVLRSASASATGSASAAAPSGTPVKTADVPVGGGVINASGLFVVTQPSAGQFKAFSAVCTHMGCTVNKVASGMIDCPCHQSQFDISTGTPTSSSQAKSPLPAKTATVSGDSVYIA